MNIVEHLKLNDGRDCIITDDGQAWVKAEDQQPIQHEQLWSVVPVAMLDVPLDTFQTRTTKDKGETVLLTLNQLKDVSSFKPIPVGSTHVLVGLQISERDNEFKRAKAMATDNNLKLMGHDLTSTDPLAIWIGLTFSEIKEMKRVNPMFKAEEDATA